MLSRLGVVGLVMVLLLSPMAVWAAQPDFEATIDLSGETDIVIGETTTLTAVWTTNRDVTRYEWSVDDVGDGEVSFDGASSGIQTFDFTGTEEGEYRVCFRIWHHNPNQSDRDATECVDVTVTAPECEWTGETAWAAGDRYVDQGNWATYTAYAGEEKSVTLYAGQTMEAGTVSFSEVSDGMVTITINLNPGWRFKDVDENVKIQDYAIEPPGNPAPGQFDHKDKADQGESSFDITVPANSYYGVHVDVEWENCEAQD